MSGPQDQRPPRRRALPTVSDVVRELRGSTTSEPELLFKAARQVCAEELNRAKQGFEPAPMEILVKRARRLLGVVEDMPTLRMERPEEMAAAGAPGAPPAAESPLAFVFEPEPEPSPEPLPAPAPPSPPVPRLAPAQAAAPAPTPRFVLSAAEEPFLETTGSIDLKGIWSRKVSLLDDPLAPLGESTPTLAPPPPSAVPEGPTMALPLGGIDLLTPPAEPLPAPPAPFQVEELPSAPAPIAAPVPVTVAVEPPTAPPAEGEAPPPAAAGTPEPSPLEPQPRAEPVSVLFPDGPGDETLDRLKVEAAAVRFEEVLPSLEPPAAPVVPDAPAPLPPPSLPEPVPAPKAIAPPAVEPLPEVPLPAAKEGVEKGSGAVRWKDVEAETSSLFSPAAAAPARSRAPLVAAVVILGAGAAAWYLLRTGRGSPPVQAPAPSSVPTEAVAPPTVSTPPVAAPTAVAAAPATAAAVPPGPAVPSAVPTAAPPAATPVPTKKAEAVPAPSVVRTQTTAPAPGQSRAATVTTPDWAGKEPVFALHFSSYRDRATADKDAARLGKTLERPGRAISIDLGEKGVWYRVMIGEFGTVEEALAYRAELEQKGTPNMGFVYRIVGKAP